MDQNPYRRTGSHVEEVQKQLWETDARSIFGNISAQFPGIFSEHVGLGKAKTYTSTNLARAF